MTGPGASAPGGGYTPAPTIRFDVINEAWQLFMQERNTWLVAVLIMMGLVVAGYIVAIITLGLGFILLPFLAIWLQAGMIRMAIKQLRGEPITAGDVLGATDVLGPVVIAALLMGLGIMAGTIACVVPGLVLAGMWMFTIPLVVDKRMDGVEAMRTSWTVLKPQMVMAAVFAFVIQFVAQAGAYACGVGVLFTMPLYPLGMALLYRDFFPESFQAPVFAPPPPPVTTPLQ